MKTRGFVLFLCVSSLLWVMGCATPPSRTVAHHQPGASKTPPPGIQPLQALPALDTSLPSRHALTPGKGRKLYSLSLRNANIREVLLAFSKKEDKNIIIDPDVTGTVTVDIKQLTFREILDLIFPPLHLEYTLKQGRFVHIFKQKPVGRLFAFNYVISDREGTSTLSASTGSSSSGDSGSSGSSGGGSSGGGGGSSTSESTIDTKEDFKLWDELASGVKDLLSPDGKLIINKASSTLFVIDYPYQLDQISSYLNSLQSILHREVMIEAEILEVYLNDAYEMGIDWNSVTALLPDGYHGTLAGGAAVMQTLNPQNARFQIGISNNKFSTLIDALGTQGDINVLSKPRISTLNNQKAVIKMGRDDVFWQVTVDTDLQTGIKTETASAQTVTEGVVLSVTPQIGSEGNVVMSIQPTVTEKVGESESRFGDTAPIMDIRETNTVVKVKSGQTIVIAGLMRTKTDEKVEQVPLLGDIPLLGALFRHTNQQARKTELVILLKATILTPQTITSIAAKDRRRMYQTYDKRGFKLGARPWRYGVKGETKDLKPFKGF